MMTHAVAEPVDHHPDPLGLADPGSFRRLDAEHLDRSRDPLDFAGYAEQLAALDLRGLGESLVAGTARIVGQDVVLVLSQFAAFGGSMGEVPGYGSSRDGHREGPTRPLPMAG